MVVMQLARLLRTCGANLSLFAGKYFYLKLMRWAAFGALAISALSGCASLTPTARVEQVSAPNRAELRASTRLPRAQKQIGRERMEYLHQRDESGRVKDDGLAKAFAAREKLLIGDAENGERAKLAGVNAATWTNLGPGNISGRTRMLVVHPNDANILWGATTRGGVWKSTDGGASWRALTDQLPANAISTLVVNPRDPNVLYAGTGEYNGRRGTGIFVTRDGGATWNALAATDVSKDVTWRFVNRIALHARIEGLMLVATNDGIFRSLDGGTTLTKVVSLTGYRTSTGAGGDGAMDIKQDPNRPERFIAGLFDGGIAITEDNGASWARVPIVTRDAEPQRVEVAFSAAQPNVVYASVDLNEGEVHKSTDGGRSWVRVSAPQHLKKQGDYDNAIWVHPTMPQLLLLGGIQLYRSLDSGASFQLFERATSEKGSNGFGAIAHSDHHAFVPASGFGIANQRVYNVNDGGIWVIDNVNAPAQDSAANQWRNLNNGIAATQVYAHASDSARRLIVGGTQDTGLIGYRIGQDAFNSWQEYALGGDYFAPQLDPTSDYGYATVYNLLAVRFRGSSVNDINLSAITICHTLTDAPNKDGRCTSTADNEKANFDAPILLDPNDPNRLYGGGNSLWVTSNPRAATVNWIPIKPSIKNADGSDGSNYISAIAVRPGNSQEVWVGHNNGEIFRTLNATAATPTWTQMQGLPARLVEAIVFDQFDRNTVYALFGGFSKGNLQISRDNGATWAALGDAKLPEVSFASLAQHPTKRDWMYLGTFVGLFTSVDGGLTWSASNDGPAAASVLKQTWLDRNTLVMSTYGRGIWQATVDTTPKKVRIYELYNASLNHYFRTQSLEEATWLTTLQGTAHWDRTNDDFDAWAANQDDGSAQPVCRFYGHATIGPNSHFYLVGRDACIAMQAEENKTPAGKQRWNLESVEFSINVPTSAGCPASAQKLIYRLYNNGFARGDSHHRYTTLQSEITRLVAAGWTNEGVVMCGM